MRCTLQLGSLRAELRQQFDTHGLKLDAIKELLEHQQRESVDNSSRLGLYTYDRKPNAPAKEKAKKAARLGSGGFGVAYRMKKKDDIDDRRFAVKMVKADHDDDDNFGR